MIKKMFLLGLLACVASAPALAEGTSKEEASGLGAGVVIGALAGGPIGAMIGGAIGAKIGIEFNERNEQVDSLSASLDQSNGQINSLQQNISNLNAQIQSVDAKLQAARDKAKPEVLALLQAGIEMDLLFRTDEHVLADSTGGKLSQLAASVSADPEIQIRLDGFADERGDEGYNQQLSRQRVEFVRDQLVAAGIQPSRISVAAHGESPAQDESIDSYALERRVSLTLFVDTTPALAANPN